MARGKAITKELVINKAIEMAQEGGIANVTYNQLARELDIRPQSMYRYVKNIKELRIILLKTFLNELVSALEKAMSGKAPADSLYAFSAELYDLCRQKPWFYESLEFMHSYGMLPELKKPLGDLTALVQSRVALLKKEDASRYTQLFMAATIGYAHMAFTPFFPESLRHDRNTYLKSMREFIDKIF